jgi:hypothetical protein
MDNVIRQRLVCNPLAHVLTQAETPRPDGRQQDVEMLKTFTWRGQVRVGEVCVSGTGGRGREVGAG